MSKWQSIATAPKDGTEIVCWAPKWDHPCFLRWKTNHRIVGANKGGKNTDGLLESYFGDPEEWDDYDLAIPGHGPTHWHPLEPLPVAAEIQNDSEKG